MDDCGEGTAKSEKIRLLEFVACGREVTEFVVVKFVEEGLPGSQVVIVRVQDLCVGEQVGGGAVVGAPAVGDEAPGAFLVEGNGGVRVRLADGIGHLGQKGDAEGETPKGRGRSVPANGSTRWRAASISRSWR